MVLQLTTTFTCTTPVPSRDSRQGVSSLLYCTCTKMAPWKHPHAHTYIRPARVVYMWCAEILYGHLNSSLEILHTIHCPWFLVCSTYCSAAGCRVRVVKTSETSVCAYACFLGADIDDIASVALLSDDRARESKILQVQDMGHGHGIWDLELESYHARVAPRRHVANS